MKLQTENTYIFLNSYSRDWKIENPNGEIKQGITHYITVQDSDTFEVVVFKLHNDYELPNRLNNGASIKLRFECNAYKNNFNLRVIGLKVQDNEHF